MLKTSGKGHETTAVKEEQLGECGHADMILTMGRLSSTLNFLEEQQRLGTTVINSPEGVRACARANIDSVMRSNGIPVAPLTGKSGYWIKRGDEAAQSKDDVVFAADETERDNKIAVFAARGITQIVVTAHVRGDLVKFYGVRGTDFSGHIIPATTACRNSATSVSTASLPTMSLTPHTLRPTPRKLHR